MYFNTIGQFSVFLKILLIGVIVGCFITLSYLIKSILGHKKWASIPIDFATTVVVFGVYFISVVFLYDGIMQPFTWIGYFIGIVIQQKTMGKLVAKVFDFLYNKMKQLGKRFLSTKIGRMLSK